MSSQQRQFQMGVDTTYTKIFVGGLAWETKRESMRRYFEQFGEIQEAVVITDKNTGRSKGYGFVTFKDQDSAFRACEDPSPVIDGRRANCNLASVGAHRSRPSTPQPNMAGMGRFRSAPPAYHGSSSTYINQPAQYPFPYSSYGTITMYMKDTSILLTTPTPGRGFIRISILITPNTLRIIRHPALGRSIFKLFNTHICHCNKSEQESFRYLPPLHRIQQV
ncbi:uncharacterized protein LOC143883627 isoform X4 [Tasmannia lanceolata]|uniref:uncharacterized protein LOC143883627 isoform X4 n=1 Tax=Tasmannia lanceolata TaxID=3420 RepID=UPI0040646A4D